MPIYEYRCDNCGHELEVLQKISEAPLVICPECAADGLKKKISAAGFRLKGGGWYETDFKSGGKKNVAPADNSSGSSATSSSDSKSSTSDSKSSTSSSGDSGSS
ncbi:MAG TPA: hypothetical protein DHU16_04985 [Gammaproteobacteria bacterium]|nr:hypothetical protein [Gammaproteobacteria bacterium]